MTNIINFNDKKKKNTEEATPKEEMNKTLDVLKDLVEKDNISGFLTVALGKENKVYSALAGEFDVILAVGGLETLKQQLLLSAGLVDDD